MIEENISLKPYNSWSVGGRADYFSKPSNIKELREVLKWASDRSEKVSLLGSGSNVLISDEGVQGLVILLDQLRGMDVSEDEESLRISAWAGTMKSDLFKVFLKYKLSPAVFLVGLPGNVGGGVVMNAGVSFSKNRVSDQFSLRGNSEKSSEKDPRRNSWKNSIERHVLRKDFPHQFSDIVSWVDVLSYESYSSKNNSNEDEKASNKSRDSHLEASFPLRRVEASKLQWFYRKSLGWQPGVIVRVGFSWPKREREEQKALKIEGEEVIEEKRPSILERVKEQAKRRVRTQPLQKLSCGSVFKNPKPHDGFDLKLHSKPFYSGELIEKSGLKGFSIGGAEVSMKHANFIVNKGEAKARDIHQLICYVREKVKKKMGIILQTEVIYLGRWSE